MNMFTWLVFTAVALTLVALGTGIVAMIRDGEVAHYESAGWMTWRVACQALAVVMVLMAMLAPR